ncbi:MAG: N-acetyl-gamma-glutamyl-phosphate reductase [Oscillospiraceae bacterium]|nr:N-acetyl-gamma-glutamyl-phosphate reductase [Oscillospiraceae bacterium]
MIKAAVLGATGYAGIELVRILARHPGVSIGIVNSKTFKGQKISDVYPNLTGIFDMPCTELDLDKAAECDVAFTALPHGASKDVIPSLLEKGLKVIDLSGDYRYDDAGVYEEWYGEKHSSPELLAESVYGLCELHRDKIKNARLIGNPGCYTTCSILGAAPLVANGIIDNKSIIIDAKSGVSGAGRGLNLAQHFCECTENTKAYKIGTHRHTSEIEQELSNIAGEKIMLSFTPHLIPQKRGIFSTIYANLSGEYKTGDVLDMYKEYYKDEFFVRVRDGIPETKFVCGSNFVDTGVTVDERLGRVIATSVIDNLFKGAAGQAVQNMNIMFGFDEKTALADAGYYI